MENLEHDIQAFSVDVDDPNQHLAEDNVNDDKIETKSRKKKKQKKKKKAGAMSQPVCKAFPDGKYPIGEFILSNKMHTSETDDLKKLSEENVDLYYERLNSLRHAAEVHRRVRMHMAPKMIPGVDLSKFCQELEEHVYKLVVVDGIKANMAFPTGVSVNECAAHYTPDIEESYILKEGDIVKIDFGVHINGHLVDSAFTINHNPMYENLRKATIEATNEALKLSGPDAYISDISRVIFETISSFEVHDNKGNVLPVKCIENLNGHQIEPYIIHAGKTIPPLASGYGKLGRMVPNEQYAIETFASVNGDGYVHDRGASTHFMTSPGMNNFSHKMDSVTQVLRTIKDNHSSLAFCQRFLKRKLPNFSKGQLNWCLDTLVKQQRLKGYPPLCDKNGSMTSQMEHTLFIKENGSEIITRGPDY